ncbi:MAG TPA: RDD family protein [Candidatus Bathyarchaeia archaeon]|nr:RDD family protein [Candidatus Bathyarchaeia archaeon]
MSEKQQTIKAELATVQQRIFAGLIDWAIMFGFILVVELLASIPSWIATGLLNRALLNPFDPNYSQWLATAATLGIIASILYAILSLLSALLGLLYFVWYPMNKNGQTFGKKRQNIQIVIIEDEALTKVRPVVKGDFVPLLIRWLLMVVDGIAFGLVGYFFITNSPNMQRLGDQLAKTAVTVVGKTPAKKTTTTTTPAKKTTTTTTPAKKTTTTAPAKKTTTTTKKE